MGFLTLPAGFTLLGTLPSSVAAGGNATFQVQLDAAATGNPSGTLSFNNNDGDENPFDFTLQGTVNAVPVPEIEVQDGATNVVDGTATAIDFGTTTVGTSVIKTFTVNNTGSAALNLSALNLPNGFSLVGTPPSSIAAGSSATFQIQLDANATGTFNGTLQFTNNDSDENPFDFPIKGIVNPPTVSIATTDATAAEIGGDTGTFRITRNGSTAGALTVNLAIDFNSLVTSNAGGPFYPFPADYNFSVSNGGSISGTSSTRTVIIPAGQSFVDLTVIPIDDTHAEANETLKLNLIGDLYTVDSANSNATVTIAANDTEVINNYDDPVYWMKEGSLRQAVENAIALPGADTITFAPMIRGIIDLKMALPDISGANANNTTINGPGADVLTIRRDINNPSTPQFRIFTINGVTATINGLTITNGRSNNGGGIANNGGTVTISNSHITANTAQGGGGIFNYGTMTVLNSTISNNFASFQVGGIESTASGSTLTVINSTISGNLAAGRYGGLVNGNIGTTMTLINSTISANASPVGEGGLYNAGGILNIKNTILAGNNAPSNPDYAGTLTSQGYNLIGTLSGAIIGDTTGNIVGTPGNPVNPNLGMLQNNGGPTPTLALQANSLAINGGDPAFVPPPNTDQRGVGFNRVQSGRLDIGAFESNLSSTEIRGIKWNDLDGDRARDPGEPGLAGWSIYLDLNNNSRRDAGEPSTTTDANGNYAFTVSPGTYTVAEVRQRGWRHTFPGTFVNGWGMGGNIIVSTNQTVREYTQAGTLVPPAISDAGTPVSPDISIPLVGDDGARDIIVDQHNLIHVYNGTFDPFLSSYNRSTNIWNHATHSGWSTVNNGSYGGIAKYENYVYVTDMTTFGSAADQEKGIVRFDLSNNSSQRFADTFEYMELTMGLDGVLYGLRNDASSSGRTVHAYDPLTMELLWTTTLASDVRGIAVNKNGDIFGASYNNGNIYHFNHDGTQVNVRNTGFNDIHDLDISYDGKLVAGHRFGQVIITDESLLSISSFSTGSDDTFVSFSTYQIPDRIVSPRHIVNVSLGQVVNGIDFGAIAV